MSSSDDIEASISDGSFHSSTRSGDHSSVSGTSTTGTGHSSRSKLSAAEEEELAKMESKYIRFSKILVLSILFISATVAGVLAYIFTKESEQNTFAIQVCKKMVVVSRQRSRSKTIYQLQTSYL